MTDYELNKLADLIVEKLINYPVDKVKTLEDKQMASCDSCKQEMSDGISCKVEDIDINGVKYKQVPNGEYECHDCKTPPNGFHHPGCDAERCPKCGGQIISCDCLDDIQR